MDALYGKVVAVNTSNLSEGLEVKDRLLVNLQLWLVFLLRSGFNELH